MHVIRNQTPIGDLAPGEWLCQDTNAFELGLMAGRGRVNVVNIGREVVFMAHAGSARAFRYEAGTPRNPPSEIKSILLIRSGAIGDLLLLSPCIAALRTKYPKAIIDLSCFEKHGPIIEAFGINVHVIYPIPIASVAGYDLIIPLENIVELSTETSQHAVDAYAEALGVTVTDYRPVYRVTEVELHEANFKYPRADNVHVKRRPRIAIQIHASAAIRGYHMKNWGHVILALIKLGWEVMLIGQYNPDVKKLGPTIKDCSSLTFREAAAVLATCDVFCGVDSSFFNLCPALHIPAVGLFGPVNSRTRARPELDQHTLDGVGECAPCGWTNSRAGHKFPPNGPCAKTGYCIPLAEISPQRVVEKILEVAKK